MTTLATPIVTMLAMPIVTMARASKPYLPVITIMAGGACTAPS